MRYSNSIQELIFEYDKLYKDDPPAWRRKPEWIVPTIPFVGSKYAESKCRVAFYASTEYLATHVSGNNREWDGLLKSFNRHRESFEAWKAEKNTFFPQIHMQPVSDGGLLCAVLFILFKKLGVEKEIQPEELLEELVAANVCKFTDESSDDYCPKSATKRKASIPYLKFDLEILQPEIIIIPKTIIQHNHIRDVVNDSCKSLKFTIPIYQFAKRAMGSVSNYAERGLTLKKELIEQYPQLVKWVTRATKSQNGNSYSEPEIYRYLAHIEDVLNRI